MENNKVIRRQGNIISNVYTNLSADLIELFDGFQGVSSVVQNEGENIFTKIFLDSNHRMYLMIEYNETMGVRISLHCGDGTTERENYIYIDQRTSRTDNLSYSFAKTPYGAVFSSLPNVTDSRSSVSDGCLQNFFTTFEADDGRTVNGFVFSYQARDEVSSTTNMSYIVTEDHDMLEPIDFTKCYLGGLANQTVLVNAASYTKPLVCNHLYKKVMSEENRFGKIQIGNRKFISGSHLCLECGD